MQEVAESREGVAVVVGTDPRQVTPLLLMGPLSTAHGGVGVVAGGRLASWPLISTLAGGGVRGRGDGGSTAEKYVQTRGVAGVYWASAWSILYVLRSMFTLGDSPSDNSAHKPLSGSPMLVGWIVAKTKSVCQHSLRLKVNGLYTVDTIIFYIFAMNLITLCNIPFLTLELSIYFE
jgi:hypothetical protein